MISGQSLLLLVKDMAQQLLYGGNLLFPGYGSPKSLSRRISAGAAGLYSLLYVRYDLLHTGVIVPRYTLQNCVNFVFFHYVKSLLSTNYYIRCLITSLLYL